jgi:DNA-binding response OmpR family regulator
MTENSMTAKSASSRPRVLLVEDEMLISIMLEDMLTELGYETIGPARRLDEAKKIASEVAADVAILDFNLNGESSEAVAEILAERKIPFIFATGYDRTGEVDALAHACIQKPFEQKGLIAALHKTGVQQPRG